MDQDRVGSSLDDFLREEGIYEEVTAAAIKRVPARQISPDAILARLTGSPVLSHKDRVNEHLDSSRR